jgi:short-subunit dehydrogenase
MAVCPFWTKTEFFQRAVDLEKPAVVKKYIAMYEPEKIVDRAWTDLKKGKDVSKYGFKARAQAALCKILPHKLVMSVWMKQQKL